MLLWSTTKTTKYIPGCPWTLGGENPAFTGRSVRIMHHAFDCLLGKKRFRGNHSLVIILRELWWSVMSRVPSEVLCVGVTLVWVSLIFEKCWRIITFPETNIAPENWQSQKETSIPTIHFQVQAVSFSEGTPSTVENKYPKPGCYLLKGTLHLWTLTTRPMVWLWAETWKTTPLTENPKKMMILLMEEILHHLECTKPCKRWDKLPTSTD